MTHEQIPTSSPESLTSVSPQHMGAVALAGARAELSPAEELSGHEIVRRLDEDKFVKIPPRFEDQLKDDTRTNNITYIEGVTEALARNVADEKYRERRKTVAEIEAMREFNEFLVRFEQTTLDDSLKNKAKSMREDLTFIGEREYKEAAAGIATYWKTELDNNPELKILAVTGDIEAGRVKSDEYLLEKILENFTDEEAEKYKERLLVDTDIDAIEAFEKEIIKGRRRNFKVVLPEDWMSTGQQLRSVAEVFFEEFPLVASVLEVQLIVASQEQLDKGLIVLLRNRKAATAKVKSYYRAHAEGLTVAAAIASIDFFEDVIADMVDDCREQDIEETMPPLTNTVRVYHSLNKDGLEKRKEWSLNGS